MATTARDQNIRIIESLYGCPGDGQCNETGDILLLELFDDHGCLSLLTDEAIAKLAQLQHERSGYQACA